MKNINFDTREQLEKDIQEWITKNMGVLAKYSINDIALEKRVIIWLNRQAKITEEQYRNAYMKLEEKRG